MIENRIRFQPCNEAVFDLVAGWIEANLEVDKCKIFMILSEL